jgi:hypothetical protein
MGLDQSHALDRMTVGRRPQQLHNIDHAGYTARRVSTSMLRTYSNSGTNLDGH